MKPSARSWVLFLQLLLLLDLKATGRVYCNRFLVIRNTSFACKDGKLQFRKAQLTDDDKLSLLESKGGHMLSTYMARDQRSAEENFVNPLSLQDSAVGDGYEYVSTDTSEEKRESSDIFTKKLDKKTLKHKASVLRYLNEIVEKESKILAENIMEALSESKSEEEAKEYSSSKKFRKRTRGKRHVTSLPHRTSPTPPPTPSSQIWNSTAFRNVPFVLPQQLGLKSSYISKISGTQTKVEFCHPRGSPTPDGQYLHMCTTCAATTILPENYFPSVVNEALCQPEDSSCFIVEQIPQGECKQRQLIMDVLIRKDGFCTLALKDDEMVIVDEWELYGYPRNVGCECTMHKDSVFAAFV